MWRTMNEADDDCMLDVASRLARGVHCDGWGTKGSIRGEVRYYHESSLTGSNLRW